MTPLLSKDGFLLELPGSREGLEEVHEKEGDNGRVEAHRLVRTVRRERSRGEARNDETATAKTKDQGRSLRTGSLHGCLGDTTSPAWPLPAEGAQGLRINQLSPEAKHQRERLCWESSSGLRTSDRTQTAASESTHSGKVTRRMAQCWLKLS